MALKYWTVIREIKKLQLKGNCLKRLHDKPLANSPAVLRGVGRVVSKRRWGRGVDDPRRCLV